LYGERLAAIFVAAHCPTWVLRPTELIWARLKKLVKNGLFYRLIARMARQSLLASGLPECIEESKSPRTNANGETRVGAGKIQSFRLKERMTQRRSRPRQPTRQTAAILCGSRHSTAKRRDGFVTQWRRQSLNSPCRRAKFTPFVPI
jgi:hypothetical protein